MLFQIDINGNVTGIDQTQAGVEFPLNLPPEFDASDWTVEGDIPDRILRDGNGLVRSEEEDAGPAQQFGTASVLLATDETFTASHVFDCGHATVAYVTATLVSTDADSETFGLDHLYVTASTVDSRVSDTFDPLIAVALTPALAADNDTAGMSVICSRYLQVTAEIDDGDNGDVTYAGANMPVAHLRFDVEYL